MFELEYPTRRSIRCFSETISLATDSPSVDAVRLDIGGELAVTTLPVRIGELPETSALAVKRRPHVSAKGNEYTFEIENAIPFGAEPAVFRKFRIDSELLAANIDLRMRASCRADFISAGGLLVEGPLRRVFFPGAETGETDFENIADGTVFYDADTPPSLFVAETKKSCFEFAPGDDLWRWISARRFNGIPRFTMMKDAGKLRFAWDIFRLADGIEEKPDGRNIRLTFLVSWKLKRAGRPKKIKYAEAFDTASFPWPDSAKALRPDGTGENVCFVSNAAENILKKWLRSRLDTVREGETIAVLNVAPHTCVSAAHLERAKSAALPHGDLAAILEFKNWANRQLASRGASLELIAPDDSPLKGWMTLR